ncbi:MAG: FAD-binding oxidoreductase [Desulfobacterales bacterium]|nr:FAD-binding oxidoreductase [Desulfobacterales bacterium]
MRPLPSSAEVVIIGGGIIGVSIAYYLAKRGVGEVVLMERGAMGQGTTGKCAGGIRTQFSTEINIRFSLLSLKVFERFKEEFGVDPEFRPVGYLFLAGDDRQWAILEANAQLMKTMGLGVELVAPSEIRCRWPFLRVDDLVGGSYTGCDGYAGPYEVLQGFIKGARRLGVMLREGVEVTGIHMKKGRVHAVEVATGERVVTPVVVNAAGPYAARVAAMVGLELLVRPLRRQLFFTDVIDDLPPRFPMVIDLEQGWYMRREGKGLLLAGPQDEESSFNEKVDFEAQEWTAARSLHRVPILERARIMRGLAGLYDISPDHHAIIGAFPEIEGFICANGFSGHGFQHSPAVGMLVSELIADGRAKTMDICPLRPQRFREGDLIYEPLTAFRD